MITLIIGAVGIALGYVVGAVLADRVHRRSRENHAMRQHAKFTRALARTARTNIGDA